MQESDCNATQLCNTSLRSCPVTGHGDIFSCCRNDNLRGLPVSFFMIHILGGMVLFMTDGIVVSEGLRSPKPSTEPQKLFG